MWAVLGGMFTMRRSEGGVIGECRWTGLRDRRWGVREMWRPIAICSMVGRSDEASVYRERATRGGA